jgi:hypothetical protein
MTPDNILDGERPAPLLLSPNTLVPPPLERGPQPASPTRDLVAARWPAVESLAGARRFAEAIGVLEELAIQMNRATAGEPPAWRPTLGLARRMVYHSMTQLAEHAGRPEIAHGALGRCRAWEREWGDEIAELIGGPLPRAAPHP